MILVTLHNLLSKEVLTGFSKHCNIPGIKGDHAVRKHAKILWQALSQAKVSELSLQKAIFFAVIQPGPVCSVFWARKSREREHKIVLSNLFSRASDELGTSIVFWNEIIIDRSNKLRPISEIQGGLSLPYRPIYITNVAQSYKRCKKVVIEPDISIAYINHCSIVNTSIFLKSYGIGRRLIHDSFCPTFLCLETAVLNLVYSSWTTWCVKYSSFSTIFRISLEKLWYNTRARTWEAACLLNFGYL